MFFRNRKSEKVAEMRACVDGRVIPLNEIRDPVFAEGTMGGGVGIEPDTEVIIAPCDGLVTAVMQETGHAVGLRLNNGAEILIHVGIDTVGMGGEGFQVFVKENEKVHPGDRLIRFSKSLIEKRGLDATCIVLLTNEKDYPDVKYISGQYAKTGKTKIIEFSE